MMAAGRAAEIGRSVLLLEKNQTLGKKLLLTGGGDVISQIISKIYEI